MNQWCYRVTHSGGMYISKDIRTSHPMWRDNKFNNIIALEFMLPNESVIKLSGMESYNLFVEATKDFGSDTITPKYFYILGRYEADVYLWVVGEGKAIKKQVAFGEEYNGTQSSGWKNGIKETPMAVII